MSKALAPSIPRPDFGIQPSVGRSALPFGASDEPMEAVVLHIKILSSNAAERLEVARELTRALAAQRVGSKGIVFFITDEKVETALSPLAPVAAKLASDVMQRLGIPQ